MKNYFIDLLLHIGGYEKHTQIIVIADCEDTARAYALYAECHCTDSLEWNDDVVEDDNGGMIYEIYSIQEISETELDQLEHLGLIAVTAVEAELEKSGHPDYQGES